MVSVAPDVPMPLTVRVGATGCAAVEASDSAPVPEAFTACTLNW